MESIHPLEICETNPERKENLPRKRIKRAPKHKFEADEIWNAHEKVVLLDGLKKYGFVHLDKIANAIGTKTVNQIRFFIESRRTALLRKVKAEKTQHDEKSSRKAFFHLWDNIINNEVLHRYRSNDRSAILAEVFSSIAQSESFLKVTNDAEPDLAAIYQFFSNLLSGLHPAELRPVDSMIVVTLMQILGNVIYSDDFNVERDLYSQFDTGKKDVTLLAQASRTTCNCKNNDNCHDLWEPYRVTDPALIELAREYRRTIQYFNCVHVPPVLLQKERETLKKKLFEPINKS